MKKTAVNIREIQSEITDYLSNLHFPDSPENLYDPLRYMIALGGKRIRPLLCVLAARMYKVPISASLPSSAALELFHNFTLIHDDIMDEAILRRGKPTVHCKWNRDIAILSGDLMMIKCYDLISHSDKSLVPQLYSLMNKIAVGVCEGQQMDMDFASLQNVSAEQYKNMISRKTAWLIAGALQMGGVLGGASKEDQQSLWELGLDLGMSFQIMDDYLDVFGETEKVGKSKGGDIVERKKTWLWIKAHEKGDVDQKKTLNHYYSSSLESTPKDIETVIQIFSELNLQESVKKDAFRLYQYGISKLESHFSGNPGVDQLHSLFQNIIERER